MNAAGLSDLNVGDSAPVPAPRFKWQTRFLLPGFILLAFGGLFAGSLVETLTPIVEVQAVPVVERSALTKVEVKPQTKPQAKRGAEPTGEVVAQAAGWVEPYPFGVHVSTLIGGIVESVEFLEGDAVEKGAVLARLVDEDARLALERAKAEAKAAQEAWDANIEATRKAEITTAAVEEKKAALELAKAELERERSLLWVAERNYQRRQGLVSDETISREAFDTAEAETNAQTARVTMVERQLDKLVAELRRATAEMEAAREELRLRTEERRRLETARVALAEAQLRLDRTKVRAPIDGVVMQRYVAPGSMLMVQSDNHTMSYVAELYRPDELQVRVDVPLADAAKIGIGQAAEVNVEVLPDRSFKGEVIRLTNLADIQKNTIEVKVRLIDPLPELKPEMLARVRFFAGAAAGHKGATGQQATSGASGTRSTAIFAYHEAVINDTAWLITQFDGETGIAAKRAVTLTGASDGEWLEVADGLKPGDLAIILPAGEELKEGERVKVTDLGEDK